MIFKSFQLSKLDFDKYNLYLFYGKNEGFINEVIQDYFINNFEGEIVKYDENEFLNNNEVIIGEILNKSLFCEKKILIISRTTDKSVKIAGDDFTNDIRVYMRNHHNIDIGERMAEKIKINVGAALQELEDPPPHFAVHGRDLMSGIPKEIIVTYKEIARALDQTIAQIEQAVLAALGQTPPELSADIYNTGIYLTGGGSMLRGLDKRISQKTKLPVYVAEDPLRAVARGTGIALKNTDNFPFLIR